MDVFFAVGEYGPHYKRDDERERILMRVIMGVFAVSMWGALPVLAQEFVGEVGACVIETVNGELTNMNSCKRMPSECTPTACDTAFLWQSGDFSTVITMPSAQAPVSEGWAMNGQEAYAPAALQSSDPRDCIYNASSDAVFCWVPGIDAFTVAAGGLGDAAELRVIARMAQNGAGETSGDAGLGPVLRGLQGRYIPFPTWDCNILGGEGGAMQIKDKVFYGVESACTLSNERSIGIGAGLFDVTCEGEGDTWQDQYILKLDEWGRLGWMSNDQVSVLEACE